MKAAGTMNSRITFQLRDLLLLVTLVAVALGLGGVNSLAWSAVFLVVAANVYVAIRSRSGPGRVFSLAHVGIFLGLWLAAALLTFIALEAGLSGDRRVVKLLAASVAAISGPLTGAISRDLSGCCLEVSLSILPYGALGPAVATLLQWLVRPHRWYGHAARLAAWLLGWIVWFGGGFLSLGHALS